MTAWSPLAAAIERVPQSPAVVIDEQILDDGSYRRTVLDAVDGRLRVREGTGAGRTLPVSAVVTVMERYGRPLDPAVGADGPQVQLAGGVGLRLLRFRAGVDADARDYLVLSRPDREPVAALSRVIAGALRFLARPRSED